MATCCRCGGGSPRTDDGDDRDSGPTLTPLEFLSAFTSASPDTPDAPIDWKSLITPEIVVQILRLAVILIGGDATKVASAAPEIVRMLRQGA